MNVAVRRLSCLGRMRQRSSQGARLGLPGLGIPRNEPRESRVRFLSIMSENLAPRDESYTCVNKPELVRKVK
jgi:hypothetical protein